MIKKLDNKGFAISAILYTLLILTVLLMFLVISVLSNRRAILNKLTEAAEEVINKRVSNVKVGDYVDYKPGNQDSITIDTTNYGVNGSQMIKRDTSLKWRVLNVYDDGTIDIISETVPSSNNTNLVIENALGYNNVVYLLDKACNELYGNSSLGITARNEKIEDIEAKLSLKRWDYKYFYDTNGYYGEGHTYLQASDSRYPAQWLNEVANGTNGHLSTIHLTLNAKQGTTWTGTLKKSEQTELFKGTSHFNDVDSITIQNTFWSNVNTDGSIDFTFTKEDFIVAEDIRGGTDDGTLYKNLLLATNNIDFFLSSRYSHNRYDGVTYQGEWGVQKVTSDKNIGRGTIYRTNGQEDTANATLRPIVTLKARVIDYDSEYDPNKGWSLKG